MRVTGTFANLVANRLEDGQHVLGTAVLNHRAGVGNAVEGNFDGHLASRAEFHFDIVGKEHTGATAVAVNRPIRWWL